MVRLLEVPDGTEPVVIGPHESIAILRLKPGDVIVLTIEDATEAEIHAASRSLALLRDTLGCPVLILGDRYSLQAMTSEEAEAKGAK